MIKKSFLNELSNINDYDFDFTKESLKREIFRKFARFFIKNSLPFSTGLLSLLSDIFLKKPEEPVLVDTNYGFKLLLSFSEDNIVESNIYSFGTYKPGTLYIIEKCLDFGDVFVDIGANIGMMSLYASILVGNRGKVFAFEANPTTFDIFQKNIFINSVSNIHPQDSAVGSKKGKAKIYQSNKINCHKASLIKSDETLEQGSEVEIFALDDFLKQNCVENIKFLKINVGGWELEVLKGTAEILTSKKAPIVCVEYSSSPTVAGGEAKDIYEFLKNINNFKIFKQQKGCDKISKLKEIKSFKDLPKCGNLFCFTDYQLNLISDDLFV